MDFEESDWLECWHLGQKAARKLFAGTGNANIIARAKTAAAFGRLISAGLVNLEELNALIDEVNNAD